MRSANEIQALMLQPSEPLIEDLRQLDGDILVLGAGGKMGPSLVRLALRATKAAGSGARVMAVSRFTDAKVPKILRSEGAEVINADLARDEVLAGLPESSNVVYLVGTKFGSSGGESATWATNTYLPGRVAERFASSRMVALSTGNVYPLVPVVDGGATEEAAVGPVGEYAMSCLGRERILSHLAQKNGTRIALIRLNYAVEMRYGVLVDVARKILSGQPVDLTTGHVNVVWQGYAIEVILRALRHAQNPPFVLNLTGPETVRIRSLAAALSAAMGIPVTLTGSESPTALLNDAGRCHGLFGYPAVPVAELTQATADWLRADGEVLDKPTKFERRDGQF